mgnify:CR=1 FL=1
MRIYIKMIYKSNTKKKMRKYLDVFSLIPSSPKRASNASNKPAIAKQPSPAPLASLDLTTYSTHHTKKATNFVLPNIQ